MHLTAILVVAFMVSRLVFSAPLQERGDDANAPHEDRASTITLPSPSQNAIPNTLKRSPSTSTVFPRSSLPPYNPFLDPSPAGEIANVFWNYMQHRQPFKVDPNDEAAKTALTNYIRQAILRGGVRTNTLAWAFVFMECFRIAYFRGKPSYIFQDVSSGTELVIAMIFQARSLDRPSGNDSVWMEIMKDLKPDTLPKVAKARPVVWKGLGESANLHFTETYPYRGELFQQLKTEHDKNGNVIKPTFNGSNFGGNVAELCARLLLSIKWPNKEPLPDNLELLKTHLALMLAKTPNLAGSPTGLQSKHVKFAIYHLYLLKVIPSDEILVEFLSILMAVVFNGNMSSANSAWWLELTSYRWQLTDFRRYNITATEVPMHFYLNVVVKQRFGTEWLLW